jgi:pimeloyl-ACP methyl ester carboxylesterase
LNYTLIVIPVFLLAIVIAFFVEQKVRKDVETRYPPMGSFISIDNHQLHYVKKGDGNCTVIFESALGEGALYWSEIQDSISKHTTTVSYDRSGIGWSERGDKAKNCNLISNELTELLDSLKVPKPYILVAHSIGGLTTRPFIQNSHKDIASILFIDVSHPDQLELIPNKAKSPIERLPSWIINFANEIGIVRYLFNFPYPGTNPNKDFNIVANAIRPKSVSASLEEINGLEVMVNEAALIDDFGNIPLTIITGASPDRYKYLNNEDIEIEYEKVWSEMQLDLLNLSSNSKQVSALKSGHFVNTEEPLLVIESIKEHILQDKKPNN